MSSGTRVLVTGGGGFIGSHVAEALAPDNTVTVLDDFSTGSKAHVQFLPADRIVDADVRDREAVASAVAGQDVVVHMAALMGVRRTLERPLEVLQINIDGVRNVMREAARADVERVCVASTSEVYGDAPAAPYGEDDVQAPETNYAVAKRAGERFARAYAATHDLDHTILRYFNVYGPRQDSSAYGYVIPKFVDRALSGDPIEIHGDGHQTRDFTYISDAVDCTIAALGPDGANETFNIGTGTETKIRTLAEAVADAVGGAETVHVPHPRPYVIERRLADVTKAVSMLGYEPTVSLEDGIEATVEYLSAGGRSDQYTVR
ncbi:NAD-dependent epimerase/dehydratase family protein [Natrinema salsiterrestre]|uniref:NAD-dependent epimerase/dehydratase family protein n=1 Tax=Natrinema salsiterrestre TaxID=2950540 RepID=A0A9Q4Q1R8_9EURY|nr:NAD-dependent epimerase/dehydratase family protein [Natrinema salsiterrestre]MDF9743987.1 NAD-dependent epimerase/dehydratase family protein [Natrinema salsiterrestre]